MFDGSSLPLKDNNLGTKRVVEYAKKNGVSVEAELGTVGGTEDGVVVDQKDVCYTDPQDAVEFVKQTGIDALAVAIGTNHGQYKSKTNIFFIFIITFLCFFVPSNKKFCSYIKFTNS